ncbi:MAG: hypothetical protein JSW20_06150 [Nitrospiraceae bacterium]|nr:MAG: hypothetical protein JSW20_06150 [Nitrospiraceae bacterium]
MTTLEGLSAARNMQTNSKEEVMSNTLISVEFQEVQEQGKHRTFGLAIELITSILIVLAGLAVFKFTGLYDGVTSITGKIVLGTVISYCYLAAFRHATSGDR